MSGIIEFEPADGTLTALAGTTMQELRETVSAARLELTPDVARPRTATLGGVICAGASGPDRTRIGPTRMHVLGTRAVLASGEENKSGGRLVKNVTGYDLHRLYAGSHGTLALVTEASLRLFPAPAARRLLRFECGQLEHALDAAREIAELAVQPRALSLHHDSSWTLYIDLAGREAQLDLEEQRIAAWRVADEVLSGQAAEQSAEALRDAEPDTTQTTVLHMTTRPSRLRAACDLLFEALGSLPFGITTACPTVATMDLAVEDVDAQQLSSALTQARAALAPLAARLALRGPALAHCELDPLGTPNNSLALMQRLKTTCDPNGVFASGGFHGGL